MIYNEIFLIFWWRKNEVAYNIEYNTQCSTLSFCQQVIGVSIGILTSTFFYKRYQVHTLVLNFFARVLCWKVKFLIGKSDYINFNLLHFPCCCVFIDIFKGTKAVFPMACAD